MGAQSETVQTSDLGPEFYDLRFDYPRPPITANGREHWRTRARLVADVRSATRLLASRIPDLGRCRVAMTWFVADRRRRDGGENIAPTLKPMIDGLVDAGVVRDDTPDLVIREMPVIVFEKGCTPHIVLRVSRILPEPVEVAA